MLPTLSVEIELSPSCTHPVTCLTDGQVSSIRPNNSGRWEEPEWTLQWADEATGTEWKWGRCSISEYTSIINDSVGEATILNSRVDRSCFREMSLDGVPVVSDLTEVCKNKCPSLGTIEGGERLRRSLT